MPSRADSLRMWRAWCLPAASRRGSRPEVAPRQTFCGSSAGDDPSTAVLLTPGHVDGPRDRLVAAEAIFGVAAALRGVGLAPAVRNGDEARGRDHLHLQ